MPLRLLFQVLDLLDHITHLMRLLDRKKHRPSPKREEQRDERDD